MNKITNGTWKIKILVLLTFIVLTLSVFYVNSQLTKGVPAKEFSKNLSEKYGSISIANDKAEKLIEYKLLYNTDFCLKDCYAEGTVTLYTPAKLFDNVQFINLKTTKEESKIYSFYYSDSEESYYIDVNNYTEECFEAENKSVICENKLSGTYKEERERKIWKEADKELSPGTYSWRIEGQKDIHETLDWVIETDNEKIGNFQLFEWATWNATFDNGLIMYYDFNESSPANATEVRYFINNATTMQSITYGVAGIHENAFGFAGGSTSLIKFNNTNPTTAVDWTVQNWTISLWFNSSVDGVQYFIANGQDNSVSNWLIGKRSSSQSNAIEVLGSNPNWADLDCISTTPTPLGAWTHIAVVKNGTTVTIYTNGTAYACSDTVSLTYVGAATRYFKMGGYGSGQGLNGWMDEVAIFNRTLSQSEVLGLYDNGVGTFYTSGTLPNPIYITLNNPADSSTSGSSVTFNCSATSASVIQNVSLLINGIVNYTVTDGVNNFTSLQIQRTMSSGTYNWSCISYTSNNTATSNNRTLTVDAILPQLEILSPSNATYNYSIITFSTNCSDANGISSMEYSLDGGLTNQSMAELAFGNTYWNPGGNTSTNNPIYTGTINEHSLKLNWTVNLSGDVFTLLAVRNGRVCVGTMNDQDVFYCLNLTTGAQIWNYTHVGGTTRAWAAQPYITADNDVWAGNDEEVSGNAGLYKFNSTGGVVCTIEGTGSGTDSGIKVDESNGVVYWTTFSGKEVFKINETNCAKIWNTTLSAPMEGLPAYDDNFIYTMAGNAGTPKIAHAIWLSNGTIAWNFTQNSQGTGGVTLYGDHVLFSTSTAYTLYDLNRSGFQFGNYSNAAMVNHYTYTIASKNNVSLVFTDDNPAFAINLTNYSLLWTNNYGGGNFGIITKDDKIVMVTGADLSSGGVLIANFTNGTVLNSSHAADLSYDRSSGIAMVAGWIVVQNRRGQNITAYTFNSSGIEGSGIYSATENLSDGSYSVNFYCNDTLGNLNSTSVDFSVSTAPSLAPSISIVYPQNNTVYNYTLISLNYTVSNADYCWYSNDSGIHNYSVQAAGQNFTGLTSLENSNTWTVYCNSSSGLENQSSVTFFVDTIYPLIDWADGTTQDNVNLSQNWLFLNVTYTEANFDYVNFSIYWLDDESNTGSSSVQYNTTVYSHNFTSLTDGRYWYSVKVNDLTNKSNTTSTKNTRLDTTNPNITLISPSNGSYIGTTNVYLNYSASDSGSGIKNITLNLYNQTNIIETIVNYTSGIFTPFFILTDNKYTWYAEAYDEANNYNVTTNRTFTIDTIYPQIDYTTGTAVNGANLSQSNTFVNVTVTEVNVANITFKLYNSTELLNTSIGTATSINYTGLFGRYYYNVTACDLANQCNSTETRNIFLDIYPPNITLISPANASILNYSNVNFTYNISDYVNVTESCYQEQTNKSCVGDGSAACGLNYSGGYLDTAFVNETYAIDENWDTYAHMNYVCCDPLYFFYFNYSLPYGVNFSGNLWKIKWGENHTSYLEIPIGCVFNASNNFLELRFGAQYGEPSSNVFECVNNTNNGNWDRFYGGLQNGEFENPRLYEEAMIWNVDNESLEHKEGDGSGIFNTTLYIYNQTGLFNQTTTINFSNIFLTVIGIPLTLIDGIYTWFADAFDYAGNYFASGNNTFSIDTISPNVTIIYPTNITYRQGYVYTSLVQTYLNWTVNETNSNNCWYSIDNLSIMYPVTCSQNSTPINVSFYPGASYGTHDIYFFTNDTAGNVVYDLVTATWTADIVENNLTYPTSAYETERKEFYANMSYDNIYYTAITAKFVYDSSYYNVVATTNGSFVAFNASLDIPVINVENVNKSFYWIFNLTNSSGYVSSYISGTNNLSVYDTHLVPCNGTYNVSYFNLTFYDELNNSAITQRVDLVAGYWYLGNGDTSEYLSYVNSTESLQYPFCFSPPNRNLTIAEFEVRYTGGAYGLRTWKSQLNLTNLSTDIVLYNIVNNPGAYTAIYVTNQNSQVIEGATVDMTRTIYGSPFTMEETTDAAGIASFWVNTNQYYTVTISAFNCTTTTFALRPTLPSYIFQLTCGNVTNITTNYNFPYVSPTVTIMDGITYRRAPRSGIIPTGLNLFEYRVDSYGGINNIVKIRMDLMRNDTIIASSEKYVGNESCSITRCYLNFTYNVTTDQPGLPIKGIYYVDLGRGYLALERDAQWYWTIQTNVTATNIKNFFFDLSHSFDTPNSTNADDANRAEYSRIVLIFLILAVLLAFFNKVTGYDAANPGAFLFVLVLIIFLGSTAGFFTFEGFIPGDNYAAHFVNQFILSIYMLIILGGYILRVSRRES